MTIEEKRREVLEKRINFLNEDIKSFLKKEIENEYYGRANFLQGKLDAIENILTIINMTYDENTEEDLDEWLEFERIIY